MAAHAFMPSCKREASLVGSIVWHGSCNKLVCELSRNDTTHAPQTVVTATPWLLTCCNAIPRHPLLTGNGATSITAIWTAEGWLHLAVVLDVYSRLIVGWAMASHREESLVEEALLMAVGWRKPCEELIHHSDRGSQYTSMAYQAVLAQFHMQVSMSKKADCYDNAMIESFFSSLKTECVDRQVYQSRSQAKLRCLSGSKSSLIGSDATQRWHI